MNQQVDIYDLDNKCDAEVQSPVKPSNLLTEMRDVGTVMDPPKTLLVSQDWFFSLLYRELLEAFF